MAKHFLTFHVNSLCCPYVQNIRALSFILKLFHEHIKFMHYLAILICSIFLLIRYRWHHAETGNYIDVKCWVFVRLERQLHHKVDHNRHKINDLLTFNTLHTG